VRLNRQAVGKTESKTGATLAGVRAQPIQLVAAVLPG
jgi:hypothetical protein